MELDISERVEEARVAKKQREEVGVELYKMQQELAKLHSEVESASDSYLQIKSMRAETERNLEVVVQKHDDEKAIFDKVQDKCKLYYLPEVEKQKKESEKLNATLRQIDQYNQEIKSSIHVTKRSTLKAEEELAKLEKEKKRLDYYVDSLTEQLKKLQESQVLYKHQIDGQKLESCRIKELLQDATAEMETLMMEKRNLLAQWKLAFSMVEKRDIACRGLEDKIR